MSKRCWYEIFREGSAAIVSSFPSTLATNSSGVFVKPGKASMVGKKRGQISTLFSRIYACEAPRARDQPPHERTHVQYKLSAGRAVCDHSDIDFSSQNRRVHR